MEVKEVGLVGCDFLFEVDTLRKGVRPEILPSTLGLRPLIWHIVTHLGARARVALQRFYHMASF